MDTPIIPPIKCCSKCGEEKPTTLEFFSKHSTGKYGLQASCRECCNAAMRLRNKSPKVLEKNRVRGKTERTKKQRRERNKRKGGRTDAERLYQREWQKAKYAKDIEKSRLIVRAYAAIRRARVRGVGGVYTVEDILLLYKSQCGRCWWCQKDLNGIYEIDHRIPIKHGGTNWPNNLDLACESCNARKSSKMPWEWIGRLL